LFEHLTDAVDTVLTLEETEQRYVTILVEAYMTWKNAEKDIQGRITEVENC